MEPVKDEQEITKYYGFSTENEKLPILNKIGITLIIIKVLALIVFTYAIFAISLIFITRDGSYIAFAELWLF